MILSCDSYSESTIFGNVSTSEKADGLNTRLISIKQSMKHFSTANLARGIILQ